jgi:uncharacterized protein
MADAKILSPEILLHIAESVNLPLHSLIAVIGLLNEGGTVPFIARYRKEATGNLDEVQIRDIEEKLFTSVTSSPAARPSSRPSSSRASSPMT